MKLFEPDEDPQPLGLVRPGVVRKRPIRISAALISYAYVGSITSAPVINREQRLFRCMIMDLHRAVTIYGITRLIAEVVRVA
jgi:hypothetical protein